MLAAATACVGCVVSPQPSPPFEANLAGGGIRLRPGVELTGNVVGFIADPGSVDPPDGVVLITNLDATDAPSVADVQPDGSFEIAVPGVAGQSFRFQAKNEDARSEPFDVRVSADGASVSVPATAAECLSIEPSLWAALDGPADARSVVLSNGCGVEVTIDPPRLRRGRAGFTFSPTAALAIPDGATATITVQSTEGSEVEDVLFFDVTLPESGRRALTLTRPD